MRDEMRRADRADDAASTARGSRPGVRWLDSSCDGSRPGPDYGPAWLRQSSAFPVGWSCARGRAMATPGLLQAVFLALAASIACQMRAGVIGISRCLMP